MCVLSDGCDDGAGVPCHRVRVFLGAERRGGVAGRAGRARERHGADEDHKKPPCHYRQQGRRVRALRPQLHQGKTLCSIVLSSDDNVAVLYVAFDHIIHLLRCILVPLHNVEVARFCVSIGFGLGEWVFSLAFEQNILMARS